MPRWEAVCLPGVCRSNGDRDRSGLLAGGALIPVEARPKAKPSTLKDAPMVSLSASLVDEGLSRGRIEPPTLLALL